MLLLTLNKSGIFITQSWDHMSEGQIRVLGRCSVLMYEECLMEHKTRYLYFRSFAVFSNTKVNYGGISLKLSIWYYLGKVDSFSF